MPTQKIVIASDHAGFSLKSKLVSVLSDYEVVDLGTKSEESVDYPAFADKLCNWVLKNKSLGILICGSGIGMSIRANRYPGIRAALCTTAEMSELARTHNDANVLCLGARITLPDLATQIVQTFLTTAFTGGRHQKRVELLDSSLK